MYSTRGIIGGAWGLGLIKMYTQPGTENDPQKWGGLGFKDKSQ